jgi:hypothetical protein
VEEKVTQLPIPQHTDDAVGDERKPEVVMDDDENVDTLLHAALAEAVDNDARHPDDENTTPSPVQPK